MRVGLVLENGCIMKWFVGTSGGTIVSKKGLGGVSCIIIFPKFNSLTIVEAFFNQNLMHFQIFRRIPVLEGLSENRIQHN